MVKKLFKKNFIQKVLQATSFLMDDKLSNLDKFKNQLKIS